MKKHIIPLLVLASLTVTGCFTQKKSSNSENTDLTSESAPSISSNTSESYDPLVETFPISYTETNGATITLTKKRAQPGETVTFKVVANAGYTINKVTASNTTVNNLGNGDYSFVMPERSVRITVSTSIQGDLIIAGDFSAKLEKVEGKDLYVAKNVKVPVSGDTAHFSYYVNGTKIDSLQLDETRCFANVTNSMGTEEIDIATGCTYDFYYDPTSIYSCYVIRTSVDTLPSTGEALYDRVFDGSMRSFSTEHAPNLKEINYTLVSEESKYNYNLKQYTNESLATINDYTDENDVQKYYVYKHTDLENNIYEVVNTWPKSLGNNEDDDGVWDLDPYELDGVKNHQPYSARLDIVDDLNPFTRQYANLTRHEIERRNAILGPRMGAHYGQELEYEFYDAYRHVYSGNIQINAPSYANPGYSVAGNADGSFTVTINAVVEYNHDAGSGTSDAEMHEGHINKMTMNFTKSGALTNLDWTRGDYSKSQWDFTNHKPVNESNGKVKHVTCVNTYGDYNTGSPSFDKAQYFINSISKASWYNVDNKAGKSSTVSNVMFGDVLEFYPYGNGKKTSAITDSFEYTPSTALDMWQYGVIKSDNEKVVGINGQNRYEVLDIGETTVTVGHRAKNVNGPTKSISIKSDGGKYALGFYQDARVPGYDSYGSAVSTTLEAKAGATCRYYIDVSYANYEHKAPCVYRLAFKSDEPDELGNYTYSYENPYFTVVQTGHELIIDCNTTAALALSTTKQITARVLSDYYVEGRSKTDFIFNVHPKLANDGFVGTHWRSTYKDKTTGEVLEDVYTDIYFYNKKVDGLNTLTYTGKIVDFYADATNSYMDVWNFQYTVNNLGNIIDVKITSIELEDPMYRGCSKDGFNLYFGGLDEATQMLCVCMWYETSDELGYIFGEGQNDDYGQPEITSWQGFEKVVGNN